jgi:hypothetical protein
VTARDADKTAELVERLRTLAAAVDDDRGHAKSLLTRTMREAADELAAAGVGAPGRQEGDEEPGYMDGRYTSDPVAAGLVDPDCPKCARLRDRLADEAAQKWSARQRAQQAEDRLALVTAALEAVVEADRIDAKMGYPTPGDSALGACIGLHVMPLLAALEQGGTETPDAGEETG